LVFIDQLREGVRGGPRTAATVNRYLAALSVVYTAAVKDWGWASSNPVANVRKTKELPGKPRYLSVEPTNDERARLLEACRTSDSPDLYCAVVVSLSTGGRQSEIMGLRWSQVSFTRRQITLQETKNDEPRALSLEGKAYDLLWARYIENSTDHKSLVFPAYNPDQPILLRKPFATALRRAGIENFRWHDLRHTAASYMAMSGKSLLEIKDFLGHKTLDMVIRYAHLSPSHNQAAVKDMNARYLGGL
jgi:integrase